MDLAGFYGGVHKGSVFGYSDEYGHEFHYGQDIRRHLTGTAVPSLSAGVVVRSEFQSGHGWYVTVDSGDGWFWTYSHFREQGLAVGVRVSVGDVLGRLGSTGQSTGPHTHVQRTRNPRPWVHGSEIDPWPQIVAAMTASAGGNVRPIPIEETIMAAPTSVIRNRDSGGIVVQFEPGCPVYPISLTEWSALTAATGAKYYDAPAAEYEKFVALFGTSKDWVRLAPSSHRIPVGGSADLGPVLDAIGQVPTATQNGAAARDAIVKP